MAYTGFTVSELVPSVSPARSVPPRLGLPAGVELVVANEVDEPDPDAVNNLRVPRSPAPAAVVRRNWRRVKGASGNSDSEGALDSTRLLTP